MTSVGVTVHFDAAHRLPYYEGKCFNIHGHTWHVTAEVKGVVSKKTGFVVDLAELKRDLKQIVDVYDHQFMNESFINPTCEIVAETIADILKCKKYKVHRVTVREGDGGWATYEPY